MLTADLDYTLPADRIAQQPLQERDASRLLHVRSDGGLDDMRFRHLPALLQPGDLLVANDTRVRRARLMTQTADGREVELLVLHADGDGIFECLARPARAASPGAVLRVEGSLTATVLALSAQHPGARRVRFNAREADVAGVIQELGVAPLPPYIHEPLDDAERYQTVYAAGEPDSAAAPTAGLHFTPAVLAALHERGVGWATVRLQVGLATFAPIRATHVDEHRVHEEEYALPEATAQAIARTHARGGRVIAVGTTAVRTLESCATGDGTVRAGSGSTSLFITPGHRFAVVDGLVTNFHQPRSSLLALLAAFIGSDAWRHAYGHALAHDYRFLSFGDCMLCWRRP